MNEVIITFSSLEGKMEFSKVLPHPLEWEFWGNYFRNRAEELEEQGIYALDVGIDFYLSLLC